MMRIQKYQCCFCEKPIEPGMHEVTSIIVISNWDKPDDQQGEQQLFCHLECLEQRISKSVPLCLRDLL